MECMDDGRWSVWILYYVLHYVLHFVLHYVLRYVLRYVLHYVLRYVLHCVLRYLLRYVLYYVLHYVLYYVLHYILYVTFDRTPSLASAAISDEFRRDLSAHRSDGPVDWMAPRLREGLGWAGR